jgi:hypothetical protein
MLKNIDSWCARKGDWQHAFPLDILMVPSSAIAITTTDERLACGGFSLGKTVCLGNFKFITDYFGGLRLFPRRGNEGAALMGLTLSVSSTSLWAMIEDSVEDFCTASGGEGRFGLPSPR